MADDIFGLVEAGDVAALLAHGADVSLRADDGKSAADYARESGHLELARRLEAG